MQIKRCSLPEGSLILNALPQTHYSDCFSGRFYSCQHLNVHDCTLQMFQWCPGWVRMLVNIRNAIVRPFGLRTGNAVPEKLPHSGILQKGDHLSLFEVTDCNDHEILMRINDKHLDVCTSLNLQHYRNQYELCLSTTVMFHKPGGRIYFFLIRPFHLIIMSNMLHHFISKYQTNTVNI